MFSPQTILVTGANGQLGNEFRALAPSFPAFNFLFVSKEELPVNNSEAIELFFAKQKIDLCINCAAYTAVDKAETEKEIALDINGYAVGLLAKVCMRHDTKFIHFSTDYVFDGLSDKPYEVDSPTNPVNYYGYTKLTGEQQALANNPASIVIRTSWVYSQYGKNFVKTMLQLMAQKPSINVVADQFGRPTYAEDIAAAVMHIVSSGKWQPGIYHCTNSGSVISWFDFAAAIQSIAKLNCTVNPIPTEQYPTPAKRPSYSALDLGKLSIVYALQLPEWKYSLTKCIQTLLKQ